MGLNNTQSRLIAIIGVISCLFLLSLFTNYIQYTTPHSNYIPHKTQDSLQYQIDSLKKSNLYLYDSISKYQNKIIEKDIRISNLYIKLQNEKTKNKQLVDAVDGWTDDDIIEFFSNRYNQDSIK